MHEPDKRPDKPFLNTKDVAQVLSIISFFLVLFPPIGILFSLLAIVYAKKVGNERARATAVTALVFNIVISAIILAFYLFIKEASMTV